MANYEELLKDAPKWKGALEKAILENKSDSFHIPYDDIAKAFPAADPHPNTFEINFMDEKEFKKWAKSIGFYVEQDNSKIGKYNIPQVKFQKKK